MSGAWEPSDISPLQTTEATTLRVPFITTEWPDWAYITGIVVAYDEPGWPNRGLTPTDEEVLLVAERLREYCDGWYRPSYLREMREFAPYDIDPGANLAYFIKYDHGGWGYRKRTWDHGPSFMPLYDATPESLADVIGRTQR